MSLIYCPECGHEISNAAVACPNCGRPVNAVPATPVVERKVVTGVVRKREAFPTWAYFVVGTLAVLLLFVLFVASRRDDDDLANQRVRVNANLDRASAADRNSMSSAPSSVTDVPPSGSSSITVPSESAPPVPMPSAPGYSTTVPGSSVSVPPPATKGTVVIDAKILPRTGTTPQPVRNVKFYLLDRDVETILSEADIEPIEGQTLTNSFGLSLMFPDRYGDFYRQAMAALKKHIKYAGQTDGSGKAQLGNVDPDSYYLFGMTKGAGGFAVWSAPLSVVPGENLVNLSPQRLTEVQSSSGE
ncbi:MAG: zinc-ribbon domain-containing protein [Pyrinomonadaceae bacterium]